jgi:iron complex outermembrane receptor protein
VPRRSKRRCQDRSYSEQGLALRPKGEEPMENRFRQILLSSTGITLALGVVSPAFAQDVLETVIVTAEKQSTDIQKTSVSITAIAPDETGSQGQQTLSVMVENVPGVTLNRGANLGGAAFVRGIGTTQGASSTPQLIDQIAELGSAAEDFATMDTSRIELLRGPQGTLYGKGAFAGVINIVTNDPTDKYEGNVWVEGGSYNEISSRAVANIPLSDTIALRVVAASTQQSGYMTPSEEGPLDYEAARVKLQYKPSEDFRILIKGDFVNQMVAGNDDAWPQLTLNKNFASPAFGGFNPCGGDPHVNKFGPWHSPPKYYAADACTVPAQPPVNPSPVTGVCQLVDRAETVTSNVGAEIDYSFGWADFTELANNGESGNPLGAHAASGFLGTIPPQDLYSGRNSDTVSETRLSSPADENWKWIAGFYYELTRTNAHILNHTAVTGTNAPIGGDSHTLNHVIDEAAFGQTTIPVTDRFRVIGGLRYAEDDLRVTGTKVNIATQNIIGNVAQNDVPTHKLQYKADFEFDVTPDSLIYALTSTGWRPTISTQQQQCVGKTSGHAYVPGDGSGVVAPQPQGGCVTAGAGASAVGGTVGEATSSVTSNEHVAPDSVTAYEAGSKNRFFDNKLQVNIDAYYYKFTSLFISALGVNGINQTQAIYQAQTGTKAYGSELEVTALISPNDKLYFGLSFEPTQSGESPFKFPQCYNFGNSLHPEINVISAGTSANLAACSAKNLAANPATVNWVRYTPGVSSNTALFDAPRWNGNINYKHIFDLSSGATVTASVNVHFASSMQTAANLFYDGLNPAYHQTDLSLTYDTADGKWELNAWVRNLENHVVVLGAQSSVSTAATDYVYQVLGPPRMWGVNLSAKF